MNGSSKPDSHWKSRIQGFGPEVHGAWIRNKVKTQGSRGGTKREVCKWCGNPDPRCFPECRWTSPTYTTSDSDPQGGGNPLAQEPDEVLIPEHAKLESNRFLAYREY